MGLNVATIRNQSVSIRSRGRFIDDRKSPTKRSGKSPCTASPEPGLQGKEGAQRAERERDQGRQDEDHDDAERAGGDRDSGDQPDR